MPGCLVSGFTDISTYTWYDTVPQRLLSLDSCTLHKQAACMPLYMSNTPCMFQPLRQACDLETCHLLLFLSTHVGCSQNVAS